MSKELSKIIMDLRNISFSMISEEDFERDLKYRNDKSIKTNFAYNILMMKFFDILGKLNQLEEVAVNYQRYKLFISSSDAVIDERHYLVDYFRRKNDTITLKERFVKINLWEDASINIDKCLLQEKFNKLVDESEIFVYIIGCELTDHTEEEILRAYDNYDKNINPKIIYGFFKSLTSMKNPDKISTSPGYLKRTDLYNKLIERQDHILLTYENKEQIIKKLDECYVDDIEKKLN